MSRVELPNNVWSSLRTPSGSPLMEVTISNRSSFTWSRNVADSAAGTGCWLAAASPTLIPIARTMPPLQLLLISPHIQSKCSGLGLGLVDDDASAAPALFLIEARSAIVADRA